MAIERVMVDLSNKFQQVKMLIAMIFVQSSNAGLSIITMFALKDGMSHYVFVVYRMAIATAILALFAIIFDRRTRPTMTISTLLKITLLGLLDPVLDQNLYYAGMNYTTATFASAIDNMLPVFAFIMAWAFKFEQVNLRKKESVAKVLGTVVTVGGAMLMTLFKGPLIDLPSTRTQNHRFQSQNGENQHDIFKGALAVSLYCLCLSCFFTLQAHTLKTYPTQLSLTVLISLFGLIEGAILAVVVEQKNKAAWSIHFDWKLLAAVYGGIQSGLGYYIIGLVIKYKGPVYYTAFSPLLTIIVAVLASVVLAEKMYMGRVIGAVIIVGGLYLVLWGKSKDIPVTESEESLPVIGKIGMHNK